MKTLVLAVLMLCLPLLASAAPRHQQHKGKLEAKVSATAHTVSLTWTDGNSPSTGDQYNIYRLTGACPATPPTSAPGTFTKLNTTLLSSTAYTDSGMAPGAYCYFATTSLSTASPPESGPSNLASAVVPSPTPQPPVLNNPSVN